MHFDESKVECVLVARNSGNVDLMKSVDICISFSISIDFRGRRMEVTAAAFIIVISKSH